MQRPWFLFLKKETSSKIVLRQHVVPFLVRSCRLNRQKNRDVGGHKQPSQPSNHVRSERKKSGYYMPQILSFRWHGKAFQTHSEFTPSSIKFIQGFCSALCCWAEEVAASYKCCNTYNSVNTPLIFSLLIKLQEFMINNEWSINLKLKSNCSQSVNCVFEFSPLDSDILNLSTTFRKWRNMADESGRMFWRSWK